MNAIQVELEVLRGIEVVRASGQTNMFDRPKVIKLAAEFGFEKSALWIRDHRDLYSRAMFNGFEVTDD